jgi:putative DNA primase/helicase
MVDLQWLRENREQLFAEALVRYKRGESWWDVPTDQQHEKIEARRQEDPWTGPIARFLERRTTVSLSDVLREGVDKLVEHQTANDARRVAKILREVGYENYSERVNGVKKRMWRRKPIP